jgi:hypothetical protein
LPERNCWQVDPRSHGAHSDGGGGGGGGFDAQLPATTESEPMAIAIQTLIAPAYDVGMGPRLGLAFLLAVSAACRHRDRPTSAQCDELVAEVVAGKPLPSSSGDMWQHARTVYECRVVELDNPATCDQFPSDFRDNCRARYVFWHGARLRTPETPWQSVMADGIASDCRSPASGVPQAVCSAIVDAIRAGDSSRCSGITGMPGKMCRGLASANPAACDGNADCEELAQRLVLLRQGGLDRVALDATEVDRAEAAAVLGRPNPCAPLIARLRSACGS